MAGLGCCIRAGRRGKSSVCISGLRRSSRPVITISLHTEYVLLRNVVRDGKKRSERILGLLVWGPCKRITPIRCIDTPPIQ